MTVAFTFAQRVPKSSFAKATDCLTAAQAEAKEILATANATAKSVNEELMTVLDEHEKNMAEQEEASHKLLQKHQDQQRQTQEVNAVIDAAAKVQAGFDTLTPWLGEFVETCLRKIIGQCEKPEILEATVAEATLQMKSKSELILIVSASDYKEVKTLFDANPERLRGVKLVQADADLSPGEMRLEADGGFVNIGLDAQLAALTQALDTSASSNEGGNQ